MASKYRIHSDEWPGLIKLAEECSEVTQAAMKIMGGCDDPGQVVHLEEEIGDLYAALAFFENHNTLNPVRIGNRIIMKMHRWNLRRKNKRSRMASAA